MSNEVSALNVEGQTKLCAGCSSPFVVTLPRQRICSNCKARRPADASRRWRKENPSKVRAQKRRWYRRNREKIKARARLHYQTNHDRIRDGIKEQRKAQWRKVSPEELTLLRRDPRLARPNEKTTILSSGVGREDIVCLECGAILQGLAGHLSLIHGLTAPGYKQKWGYNKKTPLMSRSRSEASSKLMKRRGLNARFKASRRPFRQPPAHPPKMPLEYRLTCRDKAQGKARPDLWKKSVDGSVATDVQIAKLHLQGFTRTQIASHVGRSLLDCCEDLQIRRERLAEKMRVSTHWIYSRTVSDW